MSIRREFQARAAGAIVAQRMMHATPGGQPLVASSVVVPAPARRSLPAKRFPTAREYEKIGSRNVSQRFAYNLHSRARFIELHPDYPLDPYEDWLPLLLKVPGVTNVEYKTSKTAQGNIGDHYQEQNFIVYNNVYPCTGVEMELTRHTHLKKNDWSTLHGVSVLQNASRRCPLARSMADSWGVRPRQRIAPFASRRRRP